ncbi:kinase-like protein [Rhizopogon salebrosus TDB-379]|nr:kinase-like protein [Rhizopogon salebrosus TDB-379]
MGDVNFKIEPIRIDPTTIRKLETLAHGSGGLREVWKCSMSTPSGTRTVAVKCIRLPKDSEGDEELIQKICKIRREAYVWIRLSHNHILPFLGITIRADFGVVPALVSPWMENKSLSDYLELEFPQLSDHRKSELIRQVAAGLFYLHEGKDIVHGDLSGTNVLVDDSGKLRISDFGLSMPLLKADNATFNSMHPGNARWMAPEHVTPDLDFEDSEEGSEIQSLQQQPTKEGDIYSFGCVMLQILSGKEPYARIKNVERVVGAIVLGMAPFHAVQIDMNVSHRQLSSQCLSREPGRRPSIVHITTTMGHLPNATRPRGDWRRNPYPGPSNDSPHHRLSAKHSTTTPPARQQYGSAHLSSHQHAPPGSTSPSRRNNYNIEDIPTQSRFLQLTRNPFFNTRNSRIEEGIELQERRTEVVDVPFGQAVPVSPFFPTGRSILLVSCRGNTQQERYRGTESKQGRRGRKRNGRQER